MNAVSVRARMVMALGAGLILFLIPPSAWLAVATRFSSDGNITDPGVTALLRHAGHLLALLCGVLALATWQRSSVQAAASWVVTCPPRQWLLLLVLAVAVPRIGWMLVQQTTPHVDLAWYHEHAQHLAAGEGYFEAGKPTAFWPIGYPLFLAALYRTFGVSLAVVKAAQLLAACGTAFLLWRVGRHVMDEAGARMAALLYACCPSAVMFTELLSTETLFALLLVGIWALLLAGDLPPWRRRVLLGVLFALGILIKPVLLPWPALGLILLAFRTPKRAALDVVVVYAAALVLILPWTLRNVRTFDRLVLVSTNAGFNLYVGNAAGATGAVRVLPETEWQPYYAMANEAERDAALRAAALADMRADPGRIAGLMPAKLAALYRDDSAALRWAGSAPGADWSPLRALLTRVTLDGYYYACVLLTGVWALRRGWRGPATGAWLVLWSWAAYITLVHAVYYGDPRYHQVLWPLLALGAGGGLRQATSRS